MAKQVLVKELPDDWTPEAADFINKVDIYNIVSSEKANEAYGH